MVNEYNKMSWFINHLPNIINHDFEYHYHNFQLYIQTEIMINEYYIFEHLKIMKFEHSLDG